MSFSKLLIKEIAKVKGFFEIHREKRGWAISDFLYIHVSQSRRALSVLLLPFVKKNYSMILNINWPTYLFGVF